MVHGVKVLRPEKIGKTIAEENVKEVLLATPSALRGERRIAIRALEAYPVVVKTLPALEEIASGHVEVSDLRLIEVEDLLGRDPVIPNLELLTANVRGRTKAVVDVISPLVLPESRTMPVEKMLSGEFFLHFGGFLDSDLRQADFDLGYSSTVQ